MTEIISQKKAKAQGLKKYFTGHVCARGHLAERYVINKCCCKCLGLHRKKYIERCGIAVIRAQTKERNKKNRAEFPEKYREYYEKSRAKKREYYQKNREKLRQYRAKNPEKRARERQRYARIADLIAVLRTEMPDLLKEFEL